jgi:para-nitrobenzyl esterase
VHGLEVPFVFGTLDVSEIGAIAGRTQAARALSECIQDAWLAFARTGRPRSSGLPDWPAHAPPRRATLELGERSVVREAPQETERALWEGLIG